MHRFLLALAVLLAPALATAQPTEADSALVNRLLVALRVDASASRMSRLSGGAEEYAAREVNPAMGAVLGAALSIDSAPLADSIRQVALEDFRPDLLRDALTFLEGDLVQRLTESASDDEPDFETLMERFEAPGDLVLADSVLVARYVTATLSQSQSPEMMRWMATSLVAHLPDDIRSTLEANGGAEHIMEQLLSPEVHALQFDTTVRGRRIGLRAVPPEDIATLATFYESESGQYVLRLMARGTLQLQIPGITDALVRSIRQAQGTSPNPEPAPLDDILDAAQVQPELIGGMEALISAVVYPELARRMGVEGQVVVGFVVDETGAVTAPEVLASPSPVLSEAALGAVRSVRFTPGRQDGQAVKVRITVPIPFRLDAPEPTEEPEIYEVVDTQPELIGGIAGLASRIVYPEDARQAGIEGNVIVQFVVGPEGQVQDAVVLRTASPRLNAAALAAVRGSRFTPGIQDGEPVHVLFAVPITFRLR